MRKKIQEKSKDGTLIKSSNGDASKASEPRKRGRWDQTIDEQFVPAKKAAGAVTPTWNDVEVSYFPFSATQMFLDDLNDFLIYFEITENSCIWK